MQAKEIGLFHRAGLTRPHANEDGASIFGLEKLLLQRPMTKGASQRCAEVALPIRIPDVSRTAVDVLSTIPKTTM